MATLASMAVHKHDVDSSKKLDDWLSGNEAGEAKASGGNVNEPAGSSS